MIEFCGNMENVIKIFIEKETIEFTIVTRNTDITLEVKYIALPCLTMLYILKEVSDHKIE